MADTSAYDLPSWSFVDPLDAQAFQLDPGFEDLLPMTPNAFGVAGWEQLESTMAHEMGNANPASRKSDVCAQNNNYPDRSSSIFTDLKAAQHSIAAENFQSVDLDELLRSTSQRATERALYMTTAAMANYASPLLDPCSSPDSSHLSSCSVSEADWEREISSTSQLAPPAPSFFGVPDAFPPPAFYPDPQHHQHHQQPPQRHRHTPDEKEGLTPLEMPDGSLRFTANWLPVDPEGGFTITAAPSSAASSRRSPCALEYPDYPQDAFISLDRGV